MLKAVIFDMDGVIVDSHPIHIRAWKRLLNSIDIVVKENDLDIVRDGKTKEEILRHFVPGLSARDISAYGELKDDLYREEAAELRLIRGVKRLLNELRWAGISTAVASSGSCWRVHQTLNTLRLRDYFAVVVTAGECVTGKSDSSIFVETAKRLQVRCEGVLVFEDSVPGTRSAAGLGMKCIGIGEGARASALMAAGAERGLPDFSGITLSELHGIFTDHSETEKALLASASVR